MTLFQHLWNAEITHSALIFTAVTWDTAIAENHTTRPVKATLIVNMWLFYSAKKCYNNWSQLRSVSWFSAIAVILRHGRENQRRPTVCNFSSLKVAVIGLQESRVVHRNRTMPLQNSIRVEIYNGIARSSLPTALVLYIVRTRAHDLPLPWLRSVRILKTIYIFTRLCSD